MKFSIALCAVFLLTAPLAGTASGQDWTWTGGTGNWSASTWNCVAGQGESCDGRTFPSQASDRVLLVGNAQILTLDLNLVTIGSLSMDDGPDLTLPIVSAVPQTLKIMNEDGLRLTGRQSNILIQGGKLELYGGGDVLIEGQSHIVFRTVPDGYVIFGGEKAYAIVQDLEAAVTIPDGAISATEGVHGFVSGGSDAGDDEIVMLYNTVIRGDISIDVHLINNGEVVIDTADTSLTLCGRPKMGAGDWIVGSTGIDDSAKLLVEAVVVGDRCQLLHIVRGTVDANTFWLSCGQVLMDKWIAANPLRRLDAAAGKIVQFGRCSPDCACIPI